MKKYLVLGEYHGGLNNKDAPRDIQRHQLVEATNVMVDKIGRLRSMGSITNHSAGDVSASIGNINGSYGLYAFRTDQTGEENLFAVGHLSGGNATIHIIEEDGTVVDNFSMGTATTFQPVFYAVEGKLRIADANFTSTVTPKWFGYIDRTHFEDASSYSYTIDEWETETAGAPEPTECTIVTSGTSYPTAGTGFDFLADVQSNSKSEWIAGTYEFGLSFIYDNIQESKIFVSPDTVAVADGEFIRFQTFAAGAKGSYSERLTGARLYARLYQQEQEWSIVYEISFRYGSRLLGNEGYPAEPSYAPWSDGASANQRKTNLIYIYSLGVDTYETLNGISRDEEVLGFSAQGTGYKCAVVANRRVFVANVKTTNEDGQTVVMGDRIMYTPVNRFDTFPTSYFLDLGINDGDEFTALAAFADRLYAFKEHVLYVINIASGSDTQWFLERVEHHKGVKNQAQVQQTEYGVVWANYHGAFLDNGSRAVNLSSQFSDTSQPLQTRPNPQVSPVAQPGAVE